jgi:5'-3' exonuclease
MGALKVHLVDGTYELFRAFFGVPPARDAEGRPVGAVRGLLATLLSLLREPGVTHVACAFDHVIESFRNELFAGYKTGEGIDPDLLAQFEPAEGAAVALGLVVWPMV